MPRLICKTFKLATNEDHLYKAAEAAEAANRRQAEYGARSASEPAAPRTRDYVNDAGDSPGAADTELPGPRRLQD